MEKKLKGSSETTREITKLDKTWKDWWIGFLEGDGSFFIRSNNTLGFEISQKSLDAQVLYYIKKELGFGKVNHNSISKLSRFIISSKPEGYLKMLEILKVSELRLIKRQNQYGKWIERANLLTNNRKLEEQNPTLKNPSWEDSWLSGFIDAEGCFRISYEKGLDKYRLFFQITQDELEIIEKIKELFGKKHRGSIIKDRNTYLLMISGKEARELIINYLNKYPLKTQKRIAFIKWEKSHKLLTEMTMENKEETLEKLKKLKESINKVS